MNSLENIIISQTTYTEEEAKHKLIEHNGDHVSVIKEYMGIKPKKNDDKIKIKSLNQEIYKQIRTTLDKSMKEYRESNPINIEHVANNLKESEERQKQLKNNRH